MAGEHDLALLLREMRPELHTASYRYCTVTPEEAEGLSAMAWALVREREGVTLIVEQHVAAARGIAGAGPWARITLTIHSDLAAVGLTAAVSAALAQVGISCNMVAGYYHDHLFVPWDQRIAALAQLHALAGGARSD